MIMNNIISLFHHIHHNNGEHQVHHCGGKHVKIDSKLDYTIKHCSCNKHSINKEQAVGHATGRQLDSIEVRIHFLEKCPEGGWHLESGTKI